MRRFVLALATVVAVSLHADPTLDLLKARRVRNYLRLKPTIQGGKLELRYTVDDPGNNFQHTLFDGQTFRSDDAISVRIADYNPLRTSVNATLTSSDDPNFGAIKGFLETALGVAGTLSPDIKDKLEKLASNAATSLAARTTSAAGGNPAPPMAPCEVLDKELLVMWNAISKPTIDSGQIDAWASLRGRKAIGNAANDVKTELIQLENNVSAISRGLAAIERRAAADRSPAELCQAVQAETLATILAIARGAAVSVNAQKELAKELEKLRLSLDNAATKGVWFDGSGEETDYEIQALADGPKMRSLKVDLAQRSFTIDDKVLTVKETATATRTVVFRHHSILVPEVGAAVLVNRVEYPRYGTAQNAAGQTIVASAGEDENRYNAGVTLNWLFPLDIGFAYPALQVGVATGKDAPGAMAGFALRFFEPRNLSVGIGALFTWRKELDSLSVGDPVSGTAAIEEDLKLQSGPTRLYLAFQFNF